MADTIISNEDITKFMFKLTKDQKYQVLQSLKEELKQPNYVLLNVGYASRITEDYHINEMLKVEGDFKILVVGSCYESIHKNRFNCMKDKDNEYYEHPFGRKIWDMCNSRYWNGVLIESSNPIKDTVNLLIKIQDFDHCAGLALPYKINDQIIIVDDEEITITVQEFDTESG